MNIDDLHRTSLMFLRVAIEKIVADSAIKKKENAPLKKACEHALDELKSLEAAQGSGQVNGTNGILPDIGRGIEADRFFLPFELACRSKSPKIVSTSLDCLQKLIAFGQLTGKGPDPSNPDRLLIDRIVEAICSAFHSSGNKEDVLLQIIKALLVVILSPTCEVHESALLMTVKTCFNIYLTTTNPVNQATAKGSLAQVINKVFTTMEEHGSEKDDPTTVRDVMDYLVTCTVNEYSGLDESDSRSRGAGSTVAESELPNEDQCQFPNVYQKDAYLVFRALCILAQKEDSEPNQGNYGLQSKILAMEMILLILQNSSNVLQNSKPFIVLIKKTLCVALSRNANSPVEEVFEKSLAIFVQLLDKFKVHLKLQIEVFFREIIISMLDSATCSFQHKWIVLNTIAKILGNPQSIVDLFVNYDCDMTSHNVFRSLVDVVSKTAGTAVSINSPPDVRIGERSMRLMGLSCLSDLLNCLVEWFVACEIAKCSARNNDSDDGNNEEPMSPSVHQFEHLKLQKDLMEQGILLFGQKPKKGLEFLQKHGFVGTDPVEIAEFLTKEDRLDKTTVGDYLGDPDEFNKQVMYAYVDDMDFSQRDIVTALRLFLEKFRLPGEAQKIDRLMEKFASRYCECNPSLGMFASADTAYVLAYSIILLTTDLHSAQVKNKMTKDQYVHMNRGINNGGDLPRDLIEAVYDDISKNEIKMKAGASKLLKSTQYNNSDKQKKVMTALELDAISETARALMESASLSDSNFTPAQHQHHVKPMFKICWTPCLAAFSQGIQSSDDFEEWSICIRGFRLGVRAACILRSGVQRKAFIQALARFTCLNGRTGMSEIKEKNVDIIKLLLIIGDEDGDFLEESWHDIIRCISQLELAQLIGTGTGNSIANKDKDSVRNYVKMNTGSMDERTLASLQGTLGETTSQTVVVAVDKIFHGSSRLSGEGIVHFVTALCDVSREELSQLGAPRMFLLQKLVEVAFYNMSRIRLEWRRIWVVVGAHFDMAGCNTNDVVAHFAVDALRQLAFKFLEKGELPAFRFQKDFLRPFEVIVNTNRSIITRELVVHCCSILVDAHADRLKSGWLNLFSVWKKVAVDTNADILEKAFSSCEKVVRVQFDKDFASVLDSFQEAVSCLAEFACNTINQDIQMEAIKLIKRCAEYVANKTKIILDAPYELQGNESYRVNDDQKVWLRGWFPIFFELHTIINRTKLDARTSSLSTLFQIMRNHGETFHTDWWKDLFNIVFRIFDKAKREERSDKREWMMTTCHHALLSVVEVYTQFFPELGSMLLPSIYEQCALCIQQQHEQLAKNAITCLETLILSNGHRFNEDMWQQTIVLFRNLFSSTLPKSLLTWQPTSSSSEHSSNGLLSPGSSSIKRGGSPFSDDETSTDTRIPSIDGRPNGMPHPDAIFSEQIVFCVVQSELVDTVTRIVLGTKAVTERDSTQCALRSPNPQTDKLVNGTANASADDGLFSILSPPLLLSLVEALAESQRLAKQFNDNNGQRTLLWKAGLRGASKPNLIRQETHALRAMLAILLRLLNDPRSEEVKKQVAQGVLGVVSAALCGYGEAGSETRRSAYSPVVCELLNECIQLPDELIPNLGPEFPLRLCELVETAEGQILRSLLSTLLKRFLARDGMLNGHCTPVEEQLHVDALPRSINYVVVAYPIVDGREIGSALKMAVLGFHIVVSLIVLTIISKLGTRISIIQLYIVKGLQRFIAPSNTELRSLMPARQEKSNPRQRKKQREEEDANGFKVPKQLPLQLRLTDVNEAELQQFPLYTSVHWLSLFVPLCLVVYILSEGFLYLFPSNGDTNVSVLWLIIAIAFVLQVLTKLTAWLMVNVDERGVLFTFAALYFLISCIFTMWSDRFFDCNMLEAYDHFSANVAKMMVETGAVTELDERLKSPLLLYISLSVFFSFLSSMMVFPSFRFATMYTRALEVASRSEKVMLHLSFLMPLFTLFLFLHPVTYHLVDGPRKLLTKEQLDILRVYVVIFTLLLRMWVRQPHLQAHLDLAHEKVQLLQKETGYVKNTHLQTLILRYYSYFCAAVLQYFAPILLCFFFALLLKTTGGLSWVAAPGFTEVTSSTATMTTIRAIFNTFVCKSFWSYSLIITTFINFTLSLIGLLYNNYFSI